MLVVTGMMGEFLMDFFFLGDHLLLRGLRSPSASAACLFDLVS